MAIRRYVATTTRDAMALVRRELGDDAVILANRRTAAGQVEILAAAPDAVDALVDGPPTIAARPAVSGRSDGRPLGSAQGSARSGAQRSAPPTINQSLSSSTRQPATRGGVRTARDDAPMSMESFQEFVRRQAQAEAPRTVRREVSCEMPREVMRETPREMPRATRYTQEGAQRAAPRTIARELPAAAVAPQAAPMINRVSGAAMYRDVAADTGATAARDDDYEALFAATRPGRDDSEGEWRNTQFGAVWDAPRAAQPAAQPAQPASAARTAAGAPQRPARVVAPTPEAPQIAQMPPAVFRRRPAHVAPPAETASAAAPAALVPAAQPSAAQLAPAPQVPAVQANLELPTAAPAVVAQPAQAPVATQTIAQPIAAAQPSVTQPAAAQSAVAQLVVEQPVVEQPVVEQPVVAQPGAAQIAPQPAAQPDLAYATVSQPAVAQPAIAAVQPAAAQPTAPQLATPRLAAAPASPAEPALMLPTTQPSVAAPATPAQDASQAIAPQPVTQPAPPFVRLPLPDAAPVAIQPASLPVPLAVSAPTQNAAQAAAQSAAHAAAQSAAQSAAQVAAQAAAQAAAHSAVQFAGQFAAHPTQITQPATQPVPLAMPQAPQATAPRSDTQPAALDARLLAELQSMRSAMQQQMLSFSAAMAADGTRRNPAQARAMARLLSAGFSVEVTRRIVNHMPASTEFNDAEAWLQEVLALNVRCASQTEGIIERAGIYALVGPTGVGKTTTVAKLAARYAVLHGAGSLGLITLDAYRIAAPEQLRTYGRILGTPVHLAQDGATLRELLATMANKKLVLIDTCGVSQRDERLGEILQMLTACSTAARPIQRVLLLNAASHAETLDESARAWRAPEAAGAILTKLDEATRIGGALDCALRHRLNLFGLTNGQRVPEDWHRAASRLLAHLALKPATQLFEMGEEESALLSGLASSV
jgi:flagellar biosynthesis protein FlhF